MHGRLRTYEVLNQKPYAADVLSVELGGRSHRWMLQVLLQRCFFIGRRYPCSVSYTAKYCLPLIKVKKKTKYHLEEKIYFIKFL